MEADAHGMMIDTRLPRYQQVRDRLVAQIAGGDWQPGMAIPSEAEIAKFHQVAIGTVRKAVDLLVAEGVLDRVQGRGTFVRRPSLDRSLFRFFRAEGRDGHRTVPEGRILHCALSPCRTEAAAVLGLDPGILAVRIDRLRLVSGMPIFAEEIWLDPVRFAPLLLLEESGFGDLLYPLYERLCGEVVASAEETLTVDIAGIDDVGNLAVARGSPIVVIDRITYGYDRHVIEWRRSRGAAAQFRYRLEIR